MRVAGISLEDSCLRLSIADKKIGFVKPFKSEDINLPQSEQEKAAVLNEVFKKSKEEYNSDCAVIGLSLSLFSLHVIDMPLLSKPDMRNALLYELEKYLPLPPEEYIYDFLVIEKVQKSAKVLVASIRKDRVSWLLKIAEDSGLSIVAVRCSFFEGINEFLANVKTENAIFIFASENAYNIAVLKGKMPVFLKAIPRAAGAIDEIEKIIASEGGEVFVSGFPEQMLLDKINAKTFSLSIANSVALSALKKPRLEMNLMPSEFVPPQKDYYPRAVAAMAAFAVALFFFTEIFSYYKDYAALKNIEEQIDRVKGKASVFLEARKKVESVYERKKFLYEFLEKKNLNIKAVAELSKTIPKDTWLTNMSIDEKGKIEIEGFSKRASSIIEPLSKSKVFKKVEFSSPIVSQDNQEKFSIKMVIAE